MVSTSADAPEDARGPGADPGETEAPVPSSEPSAPDVSSSDEADEPEVAALDLLASPAALAEYRQYAARVDELRDATRLVSVAPTFEKYLDRCGAGPFWLIRHDPPAAQRAVAESDLF